jgi:hypothetical protein
MNNNRIAVLGFGKTGQAVLEFLLAHEPLAALVLFNDSEIADRERQKVFEQRGVKFLIGAEKFSELGACRLVIMSPGFDGQNPRFAALRSQGVKVISEIEYAFSNLKQINLVKKQDNLLSKLLILRSRVGLTHAKILSYLSPLCRGLRCAAGLAASAPRLSPSAAATASPLPSA